MRSAWYGRWLQISLSIPCQAPAGTCSNSVPSKAQHCSSSSAPLLCFHATACLPACLFQARRCCFAALSVCLSVCLLSSTRSNSVHTMSETYAAAAATRTFPAWPAFSQFKPALVCFQTPVDGSFKLQAEHTSLGSSSSDGRTDGDDSLLAGTLQQRAGLFFSSGPSLLPLLLCRPVCLSPQQHTFKLRAHDEQDFRRSSSNSNSNNNEALSKSRRKVQPGPPPQRPAYVR